MVETTFRIGLADVQRISFTCKKCSIATTLPLDRWHLPEKCPRGDGWAIEDPAFRTAERDGGIAVLKYLAQHEADLQFVLRLEVLAPRAQ